MSSKAVATPSSSHPAWPATTKPTASQAAPSRPTHYLRVLLAALAQHQQLLQKPLHLRWRTHNSARARFSLRSLVSSGVLVRLV